MKSNKQILRMQQLAGLITESKIKQTQLNEGILDTVKNGIKAIKQRRLINKAYDVSDELRDIIDTLKQVPDFDEKYAAANGGSPNYTLEQITQEMENYDKALLKISKGLDAFYAFLTREY